MTNNILSKFSHYWILGAVIVVSAVAAIAYVLLYVPPSARKSTTHGSSATAQSLYHTVTATRFWVGEAADESNAYIPNHESAWVGDWMGEFGGIDDPDDRCGHKPCAFTPKQNVFYVALPFNDMDASGKPKSADILKKIPWYTGQLATGESLIKNRWVEVKCGDRVAYGQVEDVGPMYEDDVNYVFGKVAPKYQAGIDLSPALTDYLGTEGLATVQWRFIEEEASIPVGPWLDTVTRSQINY